MAEVMRKKQEEFAEEITKQAERLSEVSIVN